MGQGSYPNDSWHHHRYPAEVKHWHGAQKDSWFQHLTYHKDVQEGASNEWCEPVDDATYDALNSNCCNK